MTIADVVLNYRGLNCPLPVLRARRAFSAAKSGSIARIECTDPLSEVDIPHFARTDGHDLLGQSKDGDIFVFLVQKR